MPFDHLTENKGGSMEEKDTKDILSDDKIIELYWDRDERAISETDRKYGRYLYAIAYNIVHDHPDCEECLNDTLIAAWNSIPPNRPRKLSSFLGRIARNLAISRIRRDNAQKRCGGALILDELSEIIASPSENEDSVTDSLALRDAINSFLKIQRKDHRRIFVQRYWYSMSVSDIASDNKETEGNVKLILHRTRLKLRAHLVNLGIEL